MPIEGPTGGDMGDDDARAKAAEHLKELVSNRGRDRLRDVLGVDDGTMTGLMTASLDWPEEVWKKFRDYSLEWENTSATAPASESAEAPVKMHEVAAPEVDRAESPVEDEERETIAMEVGTVSADRGPIIDRQWERRRNLLRIASIWLVTRHPVRGAPRRNQVAVAGAVARMEGEMLYLFGETLPPTERISDPSERARAVDTRVTQSRVFTREEEQLNTGLGRLANLLPHIRRIRIDKYYNKAMAEAEAMTEPEFAMLLEEYLPTPR